VRIEQVVDAESANHLKPQQRNIMNKIGIAVIGASPLNPGWAVTAHIPAIQALPEYELRAVSTSQRRSAEAAAKAFGVAAFDNAKDLLAHPGVDLVVVAVKVPNHHELVSAAIDAGKMVLSEWPLGANPDQAIDLAARADRAGIRTAVGLQACFAPAIRHARELVAQGYVGDVLATTLVGSGIAWTDKTDRAHAYLFDPANGVTVLSVPVMHALDALHYVLGDFASVSGTATIRRKTIQIVDDGMQISGRAPDHVAISGTLENGALASIFYRGGTSRGQNLYWEINGAKGDLALTSNVGNLQVADLVLQGGREADSAVKPINLPASYSTEPGGLSGGLGANMFRLYAQLARDIRDGTHVVPDFAHAVRRHRELESIERALNSSPPAILRGMPTPDSSILA
jgi:predicted dehydrogenase